MLRGSLARGVAILVGDERVPAQEAAHPHLAEGAGPAPLPPQGQSVRVLGRVVEAHRLRVRAGPFDVAPEVALPAEREKAARHEMVEAGQEPLVAGPRVEDVALGARPVVEVAVVAGQEHSSALEAPGEGERGALLRRAGAERALEVAAEGRARPGAARAHLDDAPEGIRAVAHGPRPAGDLDRLQHHRVHVGRARPGPSLGGDPRSVEQDERPAGGEAAQRGNRRLPLGDRRRPGHVLERLGQVRGGAAGEVRGGDEGQAARRRALETGSGLGGDGERLVDRPLHLQRESPGREGLDANRPGVAAAGQHHEHVEGRPGCRHEDEAALGVGEHVARPPQDRHLRVGHREPPFLEHDPSLDRRRRRGEREQVKRGRREDRCQGKDPPPAEAPTKPQTTASRALLPVVVAEPPEALPQPPGDEAPRAMRGATISQSARPRGVKRRPAGRPPTSPARRAATRSSPARKGRSRSRSSSATSRA